MIVTLNLSKYEKTMIPPVCCLCHTGYHDEPPGCAGEFVKFKDYQAVNEVDADTGAFRLNEPSGYRYYCSRHLPHAISLSHKTAEEAFDELQSLFADEIAQDRHIEKVRQANQPLSLWQRMKGVIGR
ncbi:hypothetical protein L4C36_14215 [Photobacterium japonica]|uniref:hypothetical protein n=1 Tax=Photobacterium japonica TaxID=2910235 RepID=UPI003D10A382